jgi:hypothetical protein
MKNLHLRLLASLLVLQFVATGQTVIVQDNFTDRSKFIDNTLLTIWGSNGSATTALDLVPKSDNSSLQYNSVTLTGGGLSNSGYTASNSLKTLTSLDYQFPSVMDRGNTTVEIEFDAIWTSQSGSGEDGRLVITLMGDYPAGGASPGQIDNLTLADPFGKPLYNIRIRNNSVATNASMILYGADDNSPNPEWEKYTTGPWWLPGFSVQSGGGSPGTGGNYPVTGTRKAANSIITSTSTWRRYKIVIEPTLISLYAKNSIDPSYGAANVQMKIPTMVDQTAALNQINAFHGTSATQLPPSYNWFRYANAVRFYFRGQAQSWLANVNITTYPALSVLPIHLEKWNVVVINDQKVKLDWVSNDQNNFFIEHSINGIDFTTINETSFSTTNNKYNVVHDKPATGLNYYRLRTTNNGKVTYSKVISVIIKDEMGVTISPMPASDKLNFYFGHVLNGPVIINLFNSEMKKVKTALLSANGSINIADLKAGVYFYEINKDKQRLKSGSIIKQ